MTRPQLLDSNSTVYCDWRVNTSNCEDGRIFQQIWLVVIVFDVVMLSEICFLLGFKISQGKFKLFQKPGWTIRGNEGTMLCSVISCCSQIALGALQAFQVETSQVLKEFLFGLYVIAFLNLVVVFVFAIIRSLPDRYWDSDTDRVYRVYLPSPFLSRTLFGPLIFFTAGLVELCLYIALGFVRENGDVQSDVILYTLLMQIFFVKCLALAIILAYMLTQFSRIVHNLLDDNSGLNADVIRREKTALYRAKRIFGVCLCMACLSALVAILLGSVYDVYQNIPLSIFVACVEVNVLPFVGLMNYTFETISFVLYLSSKHKNRRASPFFSSSSSDSSHPSAHANKNALPQLINELLSSNAEPLDSS